MKSDQKSVTLSPFYFLTVRFTWLRKKTQVDLCFPFPNMISIRITQTYALLFLTCERARDNSYTHPILPNKQKFDCFRSRNRASKTCFEIGFD